MARIWREFAAFAVAAFAFAAGAYAYPGLPDSLASHWNEHGEVDGYMEKGVGTFMMPAIMLLLAVFFAVIPRIDPLGNNIEKFGAQYDRLVFVILLFMFLVYLQTLLWNLGVRVNPALVVPAGVGLLFVYLGSIMGKMKRNWFIGIRTPWTMSSDRVWEKTHALGSKLFMAAGAMVLASIPFPGAAFPVMLAAAIVPAVATVAYSYLEFRRGSSAPPKQ